MIDEEEGQEFGLPIHRPFLMSTFDDPRPFYAFARRLMLDDGMSASLKSARIYRIP